MQYDEWIKIQYSYPHDISNGIRYIGIIQSGKRTKIHKVNSSETCYILEEGNRKVN